MINNTENTTSNTGSTASYIYTYAADGARMVAESKNAVTVRSTVDGQIQSYGTFSYVGRMNFNEEYDASSAASVWRMLVSLSLPELPSFARIVKAELLLRQAGARGVLPTTRLALHAVTEEPQGITPPAFEETCIGLLNASDKGYADAHTYAFDVTSFVLSLQSGRRTLPMLLLKAANERVGHESETVLLCGVGHTGYPDGDPILRVTYETGLAAEPSSRSLSRAVGAWGESAIDLATGRLCMSFDLVESYGLRAPFGVKAYYNSALAYDAYAKRGARGHVADFSETRVGQGFWLSTAQSITPYGDGYLYTDEDGSTLYFLPKEDGKYEAADGSGMRYDPVGKTLSVGEESMTFDDDGSFLSREDEYGNRYTLTYDEGRLSRMANSAGYAVSFAYSEETGFLGSIADGAKTVSFVQDGELLTELSYGDEGRVRFAWQNGLPTSVSVCKADGTVASHTVYTYFEDGRVKEMIEYGADGTMGTTTAFAYTEEERKTVLTATEPADLAAEQPVPHILTTTYAFDHEGEIVSTHLQSSLEGELGTGDAGRYTSAAHVENLLRDPCLEDGCLSVSNAQNVTVLEDEANAKLGKHVLSFRAENESAAHYASLCEKTGVPAGDYTFSAYVKLPTPIQGGADAGVFLRVYDEFRNLTVAESEHVTCACEYVRLSVPFSAVSERSVRLEIHQKGAGEALACGLQLEKGAGASPFNLLGRVGQASDGDNWSFSEGAERVDGVIVLTGDPNGERYARYTVPVKREAALRERFTLSGWAEASSLSSPDATFAFTAVFRYEDGTTEAHEATFVRETAAKQFVSLSFAKKECKAVAELVVSCDYSYNEGTATFFAPCLTRDGVDSDFSDTESSSSYENDEEAEDTAPTFEEAKDTYGNPLTETTFTDGELGALYRSFTYSENGDFLTEERDVRGGVTAYTKHADFAKPKIVTDRCGNETVYTYATPELISGVTSRDANGNTLSGVSYDYDVYGNMTAIRRGDGQSYLLGYDSFHNLASIGIEGKSEPLASYLYTTGGRPKSVTYANGDSVRFVYNAKGQVIEERWKNADGVKTAKYKYAYDGSGNILRSLDIYAEKEYTYNYEEGLLSRAVQYSVTLEEERQVARTVDCTVAYRYDKEGNLTKKVITLADGVEQTVYYETTDGNTIAKLTAGESTVTSHSKTDSFGRKVFDELQFGTGVVSRAFEYHKGTVTEEHTENGKVKSTPTTQLVSLITLSDGRTIAYEYDAEERITKVTDSIDGVTEYTYDALGQLLTETRNGFLINSMEYDNYGNILSKNGKAYTYGDGVWKDLLTAYDGQSISYDAQGNPTSYLGHTLTWEKGRQLTSFDGNTYTYNANGIRTSKTVGGVTHTYTLDGTKILREVWDGNTLVPLYDNEDSVCGIVYNGTPYYFVKNLQGDVIAIANARGEVEARYTYDAWGVCTITQDSVGIANINPFRYREYYYDAEIAKYYLQSRYYDAQTGRFLNTDSADVISQSSDIFDCNIYIYCHNNPTNNTDVCGAFVAQKIAEVILSAVFGMIFQLFTDFAVFLVAKLINKKSANFNPDPGDYVDSALDWAFDSIRLFPKKKRYIVNFITAMIRAVVSQIVNYISGYGFDLSSMFKNVTVAALVCAIKALMNKTAYNKIKKLNKGILKGKKLKNEKIKIKAKYKILGQKIEQCINIPNNIYGFVTDVIASL